MLVPSAADSKLSNRLMSSTKSKKLAERKRKEEADERKQTNEMTRVPIVPTGYESDPGMNRNRGMWDSLRDGISVGRPNPKRDIN